MTDQPLTDVPGTADEPLVSPPGTAVPQDVPLSEPSGVVEYNIPTPGVAMKTVYKFFQLAILNAKEELQFNEEFADEGWSFAGMCQHGARVVVLGVKLMPVEEEVEEDEVENEVEEVDLPGALGDEVDEKSAPKESVRKAKKGINPF